jgi:hypothetical protein
MRAKIQRQIRAAEERERQSRGDDISADRTTAVSNPKPAVTNVDVEAVLTRNEYRSFAEAKPNSVALIADGQPVWMYIRFNGKLGDYVLTRPDSDAGGNPKYFLFAEIGPQGEQTVQVQFAVQYAREDLMLPELKINLSPGKAGRNASIPLLLAAAGRAGAGRWNSELRLVNAPDTPREKSRVLANSPFVFDFTGGISKYPKMLRDYDSMVLRGTTDVSRMPVPGLFYSLPLKADIIASLKAEGIVPVRFYFAVDDWEEWYVGGPQPRRTRTVFAVFTYREATACFYGVVRATRTIDERSSSYGRTETAVTKGIPLACAGVE